MAFEVTQTDLGARIGRLKTKSGILETPAILPVVHPMRQIVATAEVAEMGFKAVMTNAYITLKHSEGRSVNEGIHSIIGFEGIVATDSGGYQVLEYGAVDVSPLQMVGFQEEISSDIAVVLDTPTRSDWGRKKAEWSVAQTLKAATITAESLKREDILWMGPVQGGRFPDLVANSARQTAALGFPLYALGGPVEVMEGYQYPLLVEMIWAAKQNIPLTSPLHLFGAGHPLTVPLAVALGCDLFDSASYMLYARGNRYMTSSRTYRLDELETLPCSCPACVKSAVEDIKRAAKGEKERLLARHNLYVLKQTVDEVKSAIRHGRLWELVGEKARSHPRLWEAFCLMSTYSEFLEDGTPIVKRRGLLFSGAPDQERPEAVRHERRLLNDYAPLKKQFLVLVPLVEGSPLERTELVRIGSSSSYHSAVLVCGVSVPLGPVPAELSDIYPLSQHLFPGSPDNEMLEAAVRRVEAFVRGKDFDCCFLISLPSSHRLMGLLAKRIDNTTLITAENLTQAAEKLAEALSGIMRC